jgi:Tfp pilus assembly protein PilV
MRNLMLAVLAVGGVSAMTAVMAPAPAAAAPAYPYCIQSQAFGTDCSYPTYQACQATASGRGVECIVNPRLAFNPQYGEPRRSRRAPTYY